MAHEDLQRNDKPERSSDRAFGLVFAAVFSIVAIWPLLDGAALRWWAAGVAAAFALVALARPVLLSGANRLWAKLGMLIGHVVGPVAAAVLFYAMFVPIGFITRRMGKDPLRLKIDASAKTYWVQREPPGPSGESLTNQF